MRSDLARRIERQDMREWDRQYRHLLGPIFRTPDCSCQWVSERQLCSAEDNWHLVELDDNCPDHGVTTNTD